MIKKMNQPTLVILAAGMASRYGSMKQVQAFGPGDETIMDYSIYDAIRAGFGKVVFVIRRDFADEFKSVFEAKLNGRIATDYVFQEKDSFMDEEEWPLDRVKPWGTAHAVLCAKDAVKEPFAVINADDFYGLDAFQKAFEFLSAECNKKLYAIIGYALESTLSEFGSVSRGVCDVDADGYMVAIHERVNIYKEKKKILYEEGTEKKPIARDSIVSMNFWCFDPSVFDLTRKMFKDFIKYHGTNPKAEFFIPIVADEFIRQGLGKIKVILSGSQWFGVTYKEDAEGVKKSLKKLIKKEVYPKKLWKKSEIKD
ncbi:MAG TPA: sugar phosphate nucleotidyltransferase [Chitinophagaceae bacterium]|nr:sugar phosphate nucleotidyltransferase [Chitinophagaceae bacterium]